MDEGTAAPVAYTNEKGIRWYAHAILRILTQSKIISLHIRIRSCG